MKKIILIFTLLMSIFTFSQSKYESGMKKGLEDAKNAKSAQEMLNVSAFFERIANAEKDKWLPFYYAAMYNNITGWMDEKSDKDKIAGKTLELLEKAEGLSPNNSEILCLKQMAYVMQMTVDPMSRWMTHGQLGTKALNDAKKADANNPRPYYLEAQTIMNTPEQFGGGKKNAKPIAEKAVELYAIFQLPNEFHPNWGKEEAEKILKVCSE
jgi:hypothetical protein